MSEHLRNWAGNFEYGAARVHRPATIEAIQELVHHARKVRALGTRHSFNDIADTPEDLISVEHLKRVVSLDRTAQTVTVEAGIVYGSLSRYLAREGFALHNMASLPHISVAGACATATHGSGDANGNLASAVTAMEIVTADGNCVELSRERDGEAFLGAVVGLGALGVVVRMTLNVEPAFKVAQEVFERLPVASLEAHFDEITSSAYSVSLFTDWRDDSVNQVWRKHRVGEVHAWESEDTFFGASLATEKLHPLAGMSAENCTEQMGIVGPWFERLPHFRMEYTPSNGEELQSEYLLPRRHAVAAMRAVGDLGDQLAPHLFISEVRTIAADQLWMSPCYNQACVGVHFTWKQHWPEVKRLLPLIESKLEPFEARPHWGKLFTTEPQRVQALYARLLDFRRLRHTHDPDGKFSNAFVDRYVGW
ncbi:MAG: FAD-binding protein [Fimbriimonadaceae bacterium]